MAKKKINKKELKALVTLLDDDDHEVVSHVENKIISLGNTIIPLLEFHWENIFNPIIQQKLEDLIHTMQFDLLCERLSKWKDQDESRLRGWRLRMRIQRPRSARRRDTGCSPDDTTGGPRCSPGLSNTMVIR